jgi:hypothetical protein
MNRFDIEIIGINAGTSRKPVFVIACVIQLPGKQNGGN